MKKYLNTICAVLLLSCIVISCTKDNFLERYPKSELSPEGFFNNKTDLELYTNSFYSILPGTDIFMDDFASDNVDQGSINDIVAGNIDIPTDAKEAGWTWGPLHNINYFLNHFQKADEPAAVLKNYEGIAKFFRAYFYFQKVKRFGDVPWYSKALSEDDEGLYKARDSRTLVMDSIMSDLDYAIENINEPKNVSRISKWTALALKSRVALYEGTYRKYHDYLGLQGSSDELLRESIKASEEIMNEGPYKIYTTGNYNSDYLNLFASEDANQQEYILARVYDLEYNKATSINKIFTSPTTGTPGITQSLVDSYLMVDGEPITTNPDYPNLTFWEETQGRDPRLSQTIRTPGYSRIGESTTLIPDFSNASTGYQNIKFVTTPDRDGGGNTNDLPIFRYAEILLNFAEAKAELGELTQEDVDRSINILRARVDMPNMVIGSITPDPFLLNEYENTNDPVILEIRRERRIELAMEGFRYDDLMRWEEGPLLAKTFEGMYFPGLGTYDLDQDGSEDVAIVENSSQEVAGLQNIVLGSDAVLSDGNEGNLIIHPEVNKVFETPKNYLFPLPLTELLLNPNLEQNPGWSN